MKKNTKRNRPAVTLIKEYTEKIKGKVNSARQELHRRFEHLDYSQQKKILIAHLNSTPSDRKWAYSKLIKYWDDSFMTPVQHAWEEYKEPNCTWAIARYFPKDYIMSHFEEIAPIGWNYYYMCLRFCSDNDFKIERERLAPLDYLSLAYRTGLTITDDEALNSFYHIAALLCGKDYIINHLILDSRRFYYTPNPLDFHDLDRAFFYITSLNLEDAMTEVVNWSARICQEMENYKKNLNWNITDETDKEDSLEQEQQIFIKTIINNLPDDMKEIAEKARKLQYPDENEELTKSTENNILDFDPKENSVLKDLIEKFDLKTEDTPLILR